MNVINQNPSHRPTVQVELFSTTTFYFFLSEFKMDSAWDDLDGFCLKSNFLKFLIFFIFILLMYKDVIIYRTSCFCYDSLF